MPSPLTPGLGEPALLQHVDVLVCSQVEALALARCEPTASAEAAARALLARGVRAAVVVTLGADGALALARGSADDGGALSDDVRVLRQQLAATARHAVVDTTGAGDAFNAGFLHVWQRTRDVRAALRWGCACGTLCCARVGASTEFSLEEVAEEVRALAD